MLIEIVIIVFIDKHHYQFFDMTLAMVIL